MSRAARAALGLGGLAVHAALLAGVLDAAWLPLRLAAALVALVLVPGAALLALGVTPPARGPFAPLWALGFGVAWNAVLVLACELAVVPFTALAGATLATSALLWAAAIARRAPAWPADGPGRAATAAITLAVAVVALHVAALPTPATYISDTPDHVGTLRRMLATGEAFPRDAFFRDPGALGEDPRKALWHPQVALVAALAKADPYETWRGLSAFLAPVFVLNAAAFGWLLARGRGAAVAAWAAVVVLAGATSWFPLRKAVFATFLSGELGFAALVAALADLARPARATRAAAIVLALAAAAAHVYAAIQLTVLWGGLLAGLAVRDRGASPAVRRLAATAALAGAACLPYLAWRAVATAGGANVIHAESQGLLWLWDGIRVVSPGVLWDWMGPLWVLFPAAWPALWRIGRAQPAALSILTTSVAIALVLFNPVAVAILEPRVGYLLMRMVWMLPAAGLLAWIALELAGRLARGPARARLAAAALAGAVALVVAPTARDAALAIGTPGRFRAAERPIEPERWREPLRRLDAALPPARVVLSDPLTSYAVPMFTRHHVATMVDQHGSPRDTLALERILDARDALDPYASWGRTREVIERHAVDVIVLNDRFLERPLLDYWAPGPEWFAAARARLDRAPAAFPPLDDAGDWVVYGVDRAALAALPDTAAARPHVAPHVSGRGPVARRVAADMPAVRRLALAPREAAPGDTVRGLLEWRAIEPMPAGAYHVAVRFDRDLPGGLAPPAWIGKPVRKLVERARGERYRFRADHLPVAGQYGVDLWRTDEVVRDSFELVVPADAADGAWAVRVRMLRQPHYPNYRLADYFFDEDYYAGVRLGTLVVRRRAPEAAR